MAEELEVHNEEKKLIQKIFANNIEELASILYQYEIPLEDWTYGRIFELMEMMKLGEYFLIVENGELKRKLDVINIDVYSPDSSMKLRETMQQHYDYNDSLIETTTRSLPTSISEIMKPGENPLVAAQRGVQEELKIPELDYLTYLETEELEKNSDFFPGLKTKLTIHKYNATVPLEYYNEKGYVNIEPCTAYSKVLLEWQEA